MCGRGGGMELGKGVVAWASAAAVVGWLATGFAFGTAAAADKWDVTFSSEGAAAGLVSHCTVFHGQRSEDSSGSTSTDDRQLPRLNRHGANTVVDASTSDTNAAPQSDNTNADSAGSSSGEGGSNGKASFIGQASSATTCSYFGPGCNPPDMGLAASTGFVLQGVNTQFEVLDTSSNVQPEWPVSAQAFFGVPNVRGSTGLLCDTAHKSPPFLTDPPSLYAPPGHPFSAT